MNLDNPYPVTLLADDACKVCGTILLAGRNVTGLNNDIFCPSTEGISGTWGECVQTFLSCDAQSRVDLMMFRYWPVWTCVEMATEFDLACNSASSQSDEFDFRRLAKNARTSASLKVGKTIAPPPPAKWMQSLEALRR